MGAVELLSREGEIAIAKRIEAGRDMMIMGLCESPITFHAIIHWSEALNNGEMQLREILDLDAMLSKEPPVDKMEEDEDDDSGEISEATAGPSYKDDEESRKRKNPATTRDDGEGRSNRQREDEEEEDNTLSLAQMEAALKPEALEKLRPHHRPVQEVREAPGRAGRRARRGRRFSRGQGKEIRGACAKS